MVQRDHLEVVFAPHRRRDEPGAVCRFAQLEHHHRRWMIAQPASDRVAPHATAQQQDGRSDRARAHDGLVGGNELAGDGFHTDRARSVERDAVDLDIRPSARGSA